MAILDRSLHCSFCGKSEQKVKNLIAGPSVYICNDCIDLCVGIIRETAEQMGQPLEELLPLMTGKKESFPPNHH